MSILKHKLSLSTSLNCILICQLIILKLLCFATSVDSTVSNRQPVASSSLSETLEFSDSIPGFEHHEFQSLRIKPLNSDKSVNKSTLTKVTNSAALAANLLVKKVGLPSTPKYSNSVSHHSLSNKTILNSVLIKRINNRPTITTLKSINLINTTPLPFDESDIFRKQLNKVSGLTSNGKLIHSKPLRLSKKKKAKQSTFKSVNSSSLLYIPTTASPSIATDIDNNSNNELTSSSLAPSGAQTEQFSVMVNHGGGAISTIRRTLNSGPSFEHLQIGFPPSSNQHDANGFQFNPNFGSNVDLTPPPLPIIEPLNHHPPQSVPSAKAIQQPSQDEPSLPIMHQSAKPIYSSNRNNGRLRGAHKKQVHVNRRKSAALVKDNELNNQIVPVSVGLPNSFQNVKPQDLPNFAELSFFGYRSNQDTPRSFNEREHYTTNKNSNNNNLNSNGFNYNNRNNENNNNNNFNNDLPPPPPPPINNNQLSPAQPPTNSARNEFNFNLHPFFSNDRRNQAPNNNDLYQFFDSPFMPINPPNIHNLNNNNNNNNLNNVHYHHQTMHHHNGDNHQLNQLFHQPPIDNEINSPINTPNGQFNFQRRKLTLSNGNTPALNEISNNNLGYGYPSYSVYKGDEEAGIKYPKIFRFVDGRVNLNDFEKEKKLGKIEFGKSVAEDGEYTFEHVRRDLFLILHGGSFSY